MEKHSDQLLAFMVSREENIESNTGSLHVCNSVPHYSEQEALALEERLVKKETFREAQQILMTWLERGECQETNSAHFYLLIQLCWKQKEHLEDAVRTGESLLNRSCDILKGIEEVFNVIEKQDIWGNFTQNQVENMQEMRANIWEDVSVNYEPVEIEEDPKIKLQIEVDVLTNELNAANQLKEDLKTKCKENEKEILKLNAELDKSKERRKKKEKEMHIISLLSVFLYNHPEGVNIDCISSYLNSSPIIPTAHTGEIENIMRRCPTIFKESLSIGATQEKKWTCISFTKETLTKLLN